MNPDTSATFRISYRSGLVVATLVLVVLMELASWPWGTAPLLLSWGLFLALVLAVPAVQVRADGVTLYGINRLQWSDVIAARTVSVLGLPYIVVQRRNGMRWWIPLYVNDRRGLLAMLASRPPAANALGAFATAASD